MFISIYKCVLISTLALSGVYPALGDSCDGCNSPKCADTAYRLEDLNKLKKDANLKKPTETQINTGLKKVQVKPTPKEKEEPFSSNILKLDL